MEEASYKADIVYDAGPTGCGELIMNLFITVKKCHHNKSLKLVLMTMELLKIWAA